MKDEEYIYGGLYHTQFLNGISINDDFLEDVGNATLKAIASELPVELQTHEVIMHILKIAEKELIKKRVVL